MRAGRLHVVTGLAVLAAGCELPEVVVPDGEPMVAVHAVMRPELGYQWVLVEQTLVGSDDVVSATVIPGERPPLPVAVATVTVVNSSFAGDPCGAVQFSEARPPPGMPRTPGVYWSPAGCPTMRRGDRLTLEVVTADGRFVVAGTTVVPGTGAMRLRSGRDVVTMRGPALLLNRDADTLEVEAIEPLGRALQIEVATPDSVGTLRVGFWFVVDSTRLTLPGDLPDFITGFASDSGELPDELPPVFAAGRSYVVTAGLADGNYYDFIRSGNIPPSGRGFINHLVGGIGVFGSMVAFDNVLRVVGNLDDAREGPYRVSGTVAGVAVDVALELYVAAAHADSTAASAFVVGDWVRGRLDGSIDGMFRRDSIFLRVFQVGTVPFDPSAAVLLAGPAPSGGTSTLTASWRPRFDDVAYGLGTVTISGPSPAPGAASDRSRAP